jgi:hypothetical protein
MTSSEYFTPAHILQGYPSTNRLPLSSSQLKLNTSMRHALLISLDTTSSSPQDATKCTYIQGVA